MSRPTVIGVDLQYTVEDFLQPETPLPAVSAALEWALPWVRDLEAVGADVHTVELWDRSADVSFIITLEQAFRLTRDHGWAGLTDRALAELIAWDEDEIADLVPFLAALRAEWLRGT